MLNWADKVRNSGRVSYSYRSLQRRKPYVPYSDQAAGIIRYRGLPSMRSRVVRSLHVIEAIELSDAQL